MLSRIASIALVTLIAITVIYGCALWWNNRAIEDLSYEEIEESLRSGIGWLEKNKSEILRDPNPVLWWMIKRSADLTEDKYLETLFAEYEERYLNNNMNNMWRMLFYRSAWVPVRYQDIEEMPYYNRHFIYAVSCDEDLGRYADISEQNEADFCDSHVFRQACVTHQLMGIRMMMRRECGLLPDIEQVERALESKIRRQLFWDPRVLDIYIQRTLLLVESQRGDLVRPVWIKRIIEAQSQEGGWNNFSEMAALPGNRAFGFTYRGIGIGKVDDDFHVTAQGVYLMSMLLQQYQGT